jgi:hypothetical protein
VADWKALAAEIAAQSAPREGQIFWNPKRGNCLLVNRIYEASVVGHGIRRYAQCTSFRANGAKGSMPLRVGVEALCKNYLPITRIVVETPYGNQVFSEIGDRWEPGG